MTAIQTKRATFKMMESEWSDYHKTVREISELREQIMNPYEAEDENIGGSPSGRIPAPTEKIASGLVLNKRLQHLTEIVDAIEKVYNVLPDDYKKLVRIRYWSNRQLNWDGIALEINVSRRQAIVWRNEIIQATIEYIGWR